MPRNDLNQQGDSHAGAPSIPIHSTARSIHRTVESVTSAGSFGFEPHDNPDRKKGSRWRGFTCPACEDSMVTRSTGRSNKGKYVVRTKECVNCGLKGVTAEAWVPYLEGSTSIETFDEEQKFARRERRRAKSGYHEMGCGHPMSPTSLNITMGKISEGRPLCKHRR